MTERQLSTTDAALRARIKEICVHIPCGRLRGPVPAAPGTYYFRRCWQSCPDEDSPEVWVGHDVSSAIDLCIVCARGTAGGSSRWSWLGCEDCRGLALGRHSLMNGIGVRGGASPEQQKEQAQRLVEFARNAARLQDWRQREFRRLAADFDPLADIPLRAWQEQWPPSRRASADAFSRLLDRELPLRPPK